MARIAPRLIVATLAVALLADPATVQSFCVPAQLALPVSPSSDTHFQEQAVVAPLWRFLSPAYARATARLNRLAASRATVVTSQVALGAALVAASSFLLHHGAVGPMTLAAGVPLIRGGIRLLPDQPSDLRQLEALIEQHLGFRGFFIDQFLDIPEYHPERTRLNLNIRRLDPSLGSKLYRDIQEGTWPSIDTVELPEYVGIVSLSAFPNARLITSPREPGALKVVADEGFTPRPELRFLMRGKFSRLAVGKKTSGPPSNGRPDERSLGRAEGRDDGRQDARSTFDSNGQGSLFSFAFLGLVVPSTSHPAVILAAGLILYALRRQIRKMVSDRFVPRRRYSQSLLSAA